MLDYEIEQPAARRLAAATWVFWSLAALAAVMMLLGRPLGVFVVVAVGLVAGFVFFLLVWRNRAIYELMRESGFRWVAVLVRATGWNPKLVGVVLAIPLVVFVGILVWLAITGGPDFGDEFEFDLRDVGRLLAQASVDPLAQQVDVTHVAGVLLDRSDQHLAQ